MPRALLTVTRASAWIPLVAYAVLMVFAVISYSRYGNWPHYNAPDPKRLELPFLHASATIGVLLSHLCLLIGSVVLIASAGTWKRALGFLGLVALVGMLHFSPGLWPDYLPKMRVGPAQRVQSAAVILLVAAGLVRTGFVLAVASVIAQPARRNLAMFAFLAGSLLWTFETFRGQHLFIWLID